MPSSTSSAAASAAQPLLVLDRRSLARYCTAVTWADWVRGPEVEPSIYAADFARLGAQLGALLDAGVRIFHFDVGDGQFIREITIGPVVLASISPSSTIAAGSSTAT